MKDHSKLIKPYGKMFIFTVLCGFVCFGFIAYLLIYSILLKQYFYILLSIIGLIIILIEEKKMLSYKLIIEDSCMFIAKQNFSFKFWQNDEIKIDYSEINKVTLRNVYIVILKKNNEVIKLWCLPFSKKQIELIIDILNKKTKFFNKTNLTISK